MTPSLNTSSSDSDPSKARIIECLRQYLIANDRCRKNPCGWQSCPPEDTPVWKEYAVFSEIYNKASSDLWMATDIEYDEDGFRDTVWNWRYWKVMARKCCWYQTSAWASHGKAAETMKNLGEAEEAFVKACGLQDLYKSPCSYIEEAFPNLKLNRKP